MEWEQRVGENNKSFNLFISYCQMDSRSLGKLAQETGKSLSYLKHLSMKFSWVNRAGAYDQHMAKLRFDAQKDKQLNDIACFKDQQIAASRGLTMAALELLAKLHERIVEIDLVDLKSVEIGQLLRHITYTLTAAGETEARGLGINELMQELDLINKD